MIGYWMGIVIRTFLMGLCLVLLHPLLSIPLALFVWVYPGGVYVLKRLFSETLLSDLCSEPLVMVGGIILFFHLLVRFL